MRLEAHVMLDRRRAIAGAFILAAIGLAAAPAMARSEKKWVCPPCGCADDGKVFDAPGRCPACGFDLIEKPDVKPAPATAPVAEKTEKADPASPKQQQTPPAKAPAAPSSPKATPPQ
jgi:hypothetical protein